MTLISKRKKTKFFTAVSPLKKGRKGIMLINRGLYEYGYFNACFLENMMSLMVYALKEGYTPHIELKDRGKGWTNWDTFFEQPFLTLDKVKPNCVCEIEQGTRHL